MEKRRDGLWLGGAILLALIAFSNTLANGFVFDDHFLIVNNQSLKDESYLSRIFRPAPEDNPVVDSPTANAGFLAYYRPITRALFALNYRAFGPNPLGWHAVNLALYLLVITLAFLILRRLTGRVEIYGPATLLFALHPIHSETVSWANCLVETLHAAFFLAAFLLFICRQQSVGGRRNVWFAASLLAAMCAMLSKETAVSLPLLIGGYVLLVDEHAENWRVRIRDAVASAVPYLIVVAIYFLLRYQAGGGALQGNIGVTLRSLPLALTKYLGLLLLPVNLSPAYPTRPVGSFLSLQFLVPALILIALLIIVARYYFRSPLLRCGWLLLLLPLAPLLNVGMLLPELMVQDRYLFLPSLGFCLLCGMLFAALPAEGRIPRRFLLVFVLACYGTLALQQNTYWATDLDLFAHALSVDPKSSFSHINLAGAFAEAGDMNAAEREYTEALRYNPNCSICFANIAEINYSRGDRQKAVAFYREAIRYGYRDAAILHAFAVSLMEVGEVTQGISTFEQVAALEPRSALAQFNVGQAYLITGDSTHAVEWLKRATTLEQGNPETHFLLGIAYEYSGKQSEAIEEYKNVLAIKPDHAKADESLKRIEGRINHKGTKETKKS